jgi:DNA-binding CsgD family transcriptional regulator/large-conductance mechanosensitive channel
LKKHFFLIFTFSLAILISYGNKSSVLLQKGWDELTKDNDTTALRYFALAYEKAKVDGDLENSANALLDMGICSYGASFSVGLSYCMRAMEEFKKLEKTDSQKALMGRSKCLQLISTINSRQGKYRETISLSKEAMKGFASSNDTTGYLGLIYNSLGEAYGYLGISDSSDYFHRLALKERLLTKKFIYLPGSYINVATIELKNENRNQSRVYYDRALFIADSMGNRQAKVMSLLGIGKWYLHFDKDDKKAEENFQEAANIASGLSDKSFYLKSLSQILLLKKQQGKYEESLKYADEIQRLKDTLATWEKERITKSLEVQFDVSEKDRQLNIVQEEKNIATLTNYILWGTIGFLILIAMGVILFLKKINKRDKLLLKTREELEKVTEEQKKLKEQQMLNEIEYKESQLSAMAVQMAQKNELLIELKEKMESVSNPSKDDPLYKIINKGLNQDKEWTDFNSYFESINKNFYSRIKQAYPDISPNDLKICALIKLNLSIKEMAEILNIAPDSVKTSRYRLRKKLQLNSEENLTDFILNLK